MPKLPNPGAVPGNRVARQFHNNSVMCILNFPRKLLFFIKDLEPPALAL